MAAKKRVGLPKKYAKFGFKKGWILYKKAKRKVSGAIKKTFKKKTKKKKKSSTKKPVLKRSAKTMAKSKKTVTRRRKSRKRWNTSQATDIAINSGVIGGSAIVATALVNKIPIVKDLPGWQKAGVQGISAIILLLMVPRRFVWTKKFFGGAAVGSALNLFLPNFAQDFKLFGKSRPLSSAEMESLTMGAPYAINGNNTMGKGNNNIGVPINLGVPANLGRSRFSKRGNRRYASDY